MSRSFNGGTDRITTGLTTHSTQRTWLAWVKRVDGAGSSTGRVWEKRTAGGQVEVGYISRSAPSDGHTILTRNWSSAAGQWGHSGTLVTAGVWFPLIWAYSASSTSNRPSIAVAGNIQTPAPALTPAGSPSLNTDPYVIGNRGAGDRGWSGFIAHVAIWDRLLTTAEIEALSTGTNPLDIATGLAGYWPLDTDGATEPDATGSTADATLTGTTYSTDDPIYSAPAEPPALFVGSNAPSPIYRGAQRLEAIRVGSTVVYSDPPPIAQDSFAVTNAAGVTNPIVAAGGTGWKQSEVREPGNGIFDPSESDLARRFKFFFSGTATDNTVGIGVAFSADGDVWAEYGSNPVIALGEDPYVVVNRDGTVHRDASGYMLMLSEEKRSGVSDQNGINLHRSLDGVTWTAEASNPVMEPGSPTNGGSYESSDQTSPVVWWDPDRELYFMLYEARSATQGGQVCGAWSTDCVSWTRNPNNPLIVQPASGFGSVSVVPDELIAAAGKFYLLVHGSSGGAFSQGKYETTEMNPQNWDAADWAPSGPQPLASTVSTLMAVGGPRYGRRWINHPNTTPRSMYLTEST